MKGLKVTLQGDCPDTDIVMVAQWCGEAFTELEIDRPPQLGLKGTLQSLHV